VASSGIEQLLLEVKKQIAIVSDAEKQLLDASVVVTNFVLQTLQVIQGNEDVPAVNETLAKALIQLKDFMTQRPVYVKGEVDRLMSKLDAYEQSLLVLKEVDALPLQQDSVSDADVPEDKPKKSQSKQKSSPRKISERPERLKNTRQAEEQNEGAKISQEDI